MNKYVKITLNGPLKKTFTYKLPEDFENLEPGQRVLVPFGARTKIGFYLEPSEPIKGVTIKNIIRAVDNQSLFSAELFKFCLWLSDYYFANPADCLLASLPAVYKKNIIPEYFWADGFDNNIPDEIKKIYNPKAKLTKAVITNIKSINNKLFKKLLNDAVILERLSDSLFTEKKILSGYKIENFLEFEQYYENSKFQPDAFDGSKTKTDLKTDGWNDYQIKKAVENNILSAVYDDNSNLLFDFIEAKEDLLKIELTNQQSEVYSNFKEKLNASFSVSLLHGVTGSGKTIVYCHLCRDVLQNEKTALILTPEIALTSTTLAYFRGFFGDKVTVIHSAMTEKERFESWRGIQNGRFKIVVGPRSAIFAPLPNLGLIIVDEEHDSSYKQDDPAPRFHGRDSAIMRAKINNIPILLGSASPSIESYHNAQTGRYQLLKLTKRPGKAEMPKVRIIDMKKDRIAGDMPYLSFPLKKEIEIRLKKNEQVILYLNRRGHSTQIKCTECGYVPECPNCQVSLTYHRKGRKLTCHYCGHLMPEHDICPKCHTGKYLYQGVGTQKIEENIPRIFKGALPIRLDSDSASGRTKAYQILKDFSDNKSNVLLGTQMVTKGLDLPNVTLVGVMSADMSLDLPDFRASEKAFSRLLQVSGRSGRAENKGEVLIQTYYADNEVILEASKQDYESFFKKEIHSREQLNYPPFSRLVNFIFLSEDEKLLEKTALSFRQDLLYKIKLKRLKADILGPAPCPMYYLRSKYRRHLFVKTNQMVKFVKMLSEWEIAQSHFKLPSKVRLNIDVDPDNMM